MKLIGCDYCEKIITRNMLPTTLDDSGFHEGIVAKQKTWRDKLSYFLAWWIVIMGSSSEDLRRRNIFCSQECKDLYAEEHFELRRKIV